VNPKLLVDRRPKHSYSFNRTRS